MNKTIQLGEEWHQCGQSEEKPRQGSCIIAFYQDSLYPVLLIVDDSFASGYVQPVHKGKSIQMVDFPHRIIAWTYIPSFRITDSE